MNTETVRQNYYEILDLKENATQQEIFAAYEKAKKTYSAENKALASVFSPEEADQLRQLVEEAYEVLKNESYRNVYERRILANTYSQEELTAAAIKTATEELFKKPELPVIKTEQAATVISAEKTNSIASTLSADAQVTENTDAPIVDPQYEVELQSKKDWSGDDLRQVREYRKLSFDELTDITKINPWYIAALEKMDPANLPVEVFVRGYVLQVAKALGLKEKVVADSYMRNFRRKIEN